MALRHDGAITWLSRDKHAAGVRERYDPSSDILCRLRSERDYNKYLRGTCKPSCREIGDIRPFCCSGLKKKVNAK